MNNKCHVYQKNITLEQAILGGNFIIQVENGRILRVKLRPGSFNGKVIRLKGEEGSDKNHLAKDTYIQLRVLDHPLYSLDGLNLKATLLLTAAEAEQGCLKKIVAPDGNMMGIDIKAKSSEGDEIVVKGAGLSNGNNIGDVIYKIKIDFLDYLDASVIKNDLHRDKRNLN